MTEHPEDLSEGLTAAPSPGARPAPAEPSSSISGTTVDHFEVMELLGAGASARSTGPGTGGWVGWWR